MSEYYWQRTFNGFLVPKAFYPMKFAPRDGTMIALKRERWGALHPIVAWGQIDAEGDDEPTQGWVFCEAVLNTHMTMRRLNIEDIMRNAWDEMTYFARVPEVEALLTAPDVEAADYERRRVGRSFRNVRS